jgi:hypothetical protein
MKSRARDLLVCSVKLLLKVNSIEKLQCSLRIFSSYSLKDLI